MIGIFGGSFNPIHIAHLILSEDLIVNQGFNKVQFLPCWKQPLKDQTSFVSFEHRLNMLKIATQANQHFSILDIEADLPKPSYTYNTLIELQKRGYKDFCFITGADNLNIITSWYKYRELLNEFQILFLLRPSFVLPKRYKKIGKEKLLKTRLLDISSTEIRRRLKQDLSCKEMLPRGVHEYIKREKLYTNEED